MQGPGGSEVGKVSEVVSCFFRTLLLVPATSSNSRLGR